MRTITKQEIKKFINDNPTLTSEIVAKKLKTDLGTVRGCKAANTRFGFKEVPTVLPTVPTLKKERKPRATKLEMSKRKDETNYKNADGENKQVARELMSKYIIESGVNGTIPSLPCDNCAIETMIYKANKNIDFIGVELKKTTLLKMRKTIRKNKLPIKSVFGYIGSQIFGQHENAYAGLLLDYCGQLPTFSKEIEYAINQNIVKVNGIIAMTFAKPLRGGDGITNTIKNLGFTKSNNQLDNRCMSDKAIEAYFYNLIGKNYAFLEVFYYQDTYPMVLIILKRLK